jgi:hypothetical protein
VSVEGGFTVEAVHQVLHWLLSRNRVSEPDYIEDASVTRAANVNVELKLFLKICVVPPLSDGTGWQVMRPAKWPSLIGGWARGFLGILCRVRDCVTAYAVAVNGLLRFFHT